MSGPWHRDYGTWSANANPLFLPFSTPSNDVFRNASQSPHWNQQVDDGAVQTITPTASKSKIKMVVFEVKTILGDSHYSSPPHPPPPCQFIQTLRVTDSRNNCTWCLQGVKLSGQSHDLESNPLWIQVGLCGHLKAASPPLSYLDLSSFPFLGCCSGGTSVGGPHHPPGSPHWTPSLTLTEYLL